jgi:multidrug efflux pump subunit AcrA (membrane-fusion protein)
MSATPQPRPSPQPRPTLVQTPEPKPLSRRRFYLLVLLALAAVTAIIWWLARQKVEIEVVSPVRQDIDITVSSSGVVTPAHDYPVRANFTGLVEKIYVHLGEKVQAGQMLVQMKDQYAIPRLDTAQSALKASQLSLENAEQNGSQDDLIGYAAEMQRDQTEHDDAAASLATLQQLEQRGSVSQSEVLNAERRLKLADAALGRYCQPQSARAGRSGQSRGRACFLGQCQHLIAHLRHRLFHSCLAVRLCPRRQRADARRGSHAI